jgi:large subunit ribosomal protein L22
MEVKAITKYVRISPLKARDVARNIQGLPVSKALDMLTFTPRKAALLVGKTLKSAIANAENNHDLTVDSLVIKEAVIGAGPTLKRWKPRARGGASPIKKRTSHIFITVSDEIEQPESTKKSGKTKKKQRLARAAATGKMIKGLQKGKPKAEAKPEEEVQEEVEAVEAEVAVEAAEAVAEVEEAVVEEQPVAETESAPEAEEAAAEDGAAEEGEEATEKE